MLKAGLQELNKVLQDLMQLHEPLEAPGGSVLLEELVIASNSNTDPLQSPTATPLLHAMSAAHAYIIMFVHVCRTGQSDIRNLSITHWGSELGLSVLKGLSRLYTSLVWESTVLLALCSESSSNANWQFGKHQLERLTSAMNLNDNDATTSEPSTSAVSMEIDESGDSLPDSSNKKKKATTHPSQTKMASQMKQIKPLLSSASRVGRALAELFGLLVKLCVGSPIRHRRSHHNMPTLPVVPSPAARAVASSLTKLLMSGLSWEPPSTSPIPKFR